MKGINVWPLWLGWNIDEGIWLAYIYIYNQKRVKAKHNGHLLVYPGHYPSKPRTSYDFLLTNRVARGVRFLLDFRVYPFLVETWPGIPVFGFRPKKNTEDCFKVVHACFGEYFSNCNMNAEFEMCLLLCLHAWGTLHPDLQSTTHIDLHPPITPRTRAEVNVYMGSELSTADNYLQKAAAYLPTTYPCMKRSGLFEPKISSFKGQPLYPNRRDKPQPFGCRSCR